MKKTLLLAFGLISLGASAQLQSETISYYSSSSAPRIYDGHISNKIRWSSSNKKFEFTGNSWKDFNSILFGKDGDISFATAQVWQNALPGFSNNKINQQDFENNFVKMKITHNGNVGIGTLTPNEALVVNGSLAFNYDSRGGFNGIKRNGLATEYYNIITGTPSQVIHKFTGHGNKMIMSMNQGGSVGIGTDLSSNTYKGTSNYFKLSVNGSIRAKEIVVETGWADFVFADDYKLMSLDKVEDFIEENNHLPGVPSAKSISENGLKVAESQTIQMQKIEELTLYLIEMKKELDSLKEQLSLSK